MREKCDIFFTRTNKLTNRGKILFELKFNDILKINMSGAVIRMYIPNCIYTRSILQICHDIKYQELEFAFFDCLMSVLMRSDFKGQIYK